MDTTSAQLTDNNIRLALKYAVDREAVLKIILRGYGSLGNDHPIPSSNPFFNTELPQRHYDPEKAKFYLKQAGYSSFQIDLHASVGAFAEAIDTAELFEAAAAKSGIAITVKREPPDGYWENVWMKVPFCMSYWANRPTADSMFSIAYQCNASWNDTRWCRPAFDKLLLEARAELNLEKRKVLYWEMQKMANEDGGNLIPNFADYLDGLNKRVKGFVPSPVFEFAGDRLAEQCWFES
jgi:peptide/nickel transport system substrate-binding protein